MRVVFLGLAFCLGLAACGDVPMPFRREGEAASLARPNVVRAVVVQPVEHVAAGRDLALTTVEEFIARDVPARLREAGGRDSPGSWVLDGTASAEGDSVGILWSLKPPGGGHPSRHFSLSPGWKMAGGDRAEIKRLAKELVAALIGPVDPGAQSQPPPPKGPGFVIDLPPARIPGDGATALPKALAAALAVEGFTLVLPAQAEFRIKGRVDVAPGRPGEEMLSVTWTLFGKDGKEIGSVDQQGSLPKGRLAEPWGSLARDIASGSVEGLADMLRHVVSRQGLPPP